MTKDKKFEEEKDPYKKWEEGKDPVKDLEKDWK